MAAEHEKTVTEQILEWQVAMRRAYPCPEAIFDAVQIDRFEWTGPELGLKIIRKTR